jgi:hypothetical protein
VLVVRSATGLCMQCRSPESTGGHACLPCTCCRTRPSSCYVCVCLQEGYLEGCLHLRFLRKRFLQLTVVVPVQGDWPHLPSCLVVLWPGCLCPVGLSKW